MAKRAQHHYEIVVYRSNERFILSSVHCCIVLNKVKNECVTYDLDMLKGTKSCPFVTVEMYMLLTDITAFLFVMWWLDVSHRCGVDL